MKGINHKVLPQVNLVLKAFDKVLHKNRAKRHSFSSYDTALNPCRALNFSKTAKQRHESASVIASFAAS